MGFLKVSGNQFKILHVYMQLGGSFGILINFRYGLVMIKMWACFFLRFLIIGKNLEKSYAEEVLEGFCF